MYKDFSWAASSFPLRRGWFASIRLLWPSVFRLQGNTWIGTQSTTSWDCSKGNSCWLGRFRCTIFHLVHLGLIEARSLSSLSGVTCMFRSLLYQLPCVTQPRGELIIATLCFTKKASRLSQLAFPNVVGLIYLPCWVTGVDDLATS